MVPGAEPQITGNHLIRYKFWLPLFCRYQQRYQHTRQLLRTLGEAYGGIWRKSHELRPNSNFIPVLLHTHGSTLAMHGVPMGVIAEQLGHADTRMTEKHHAHLSCGYVADTIRANSRLSALRTKQRSHQSVAAENN